MTFSKLGQQEQEGTPAARKRDAGDRSLVFSGPARAAVAGAVRAGAGGVRPAATCGVG